MSRATSDDLDTLHSVLARFMTDKIRNPGEEGIPTSLLKEAREFLKDNGINTAAGTNKALNDLASILPFADEDTGT